MTRLLRNPWTLAAAIAVAITLWMLSGVLATGADGDTSPTAADSAPADAAPRDERRMTVQVRELAAQTIERRLELSARTAPARRVLLKAETTGRVVATPAPRGRRLAAGAPLLRLDLRERQARLRQAEAAVKQRELEYEAQQALEPTGFNTQARVAEALALLEAARTELERARLDLDRMILRAPFDGVLQEREAELGDYVTPGDPLVTFLDDRTLIVAGDVNEGDVDTLEIGMNATATLPDGSVRAGRIRYISPLADASTRTFRVELALDNADGRIPLGAGARLHLPLDTVEAHAISPALLTLDDEGGLGVKIVVDGNRVRFVPVSIARSAADTVWVDGLPDPARVITVGAGFVSDGDRVDTRFESGPEAVPGLSSQRGAGTAGTPPPDADTAETADSGAPRPGTGTTPAAAREDAA